MEIIVSVSGLVGLIIQFIDQIDNWVKIVISALFFIAFIITLFLFIFKNKSVSKSKRISKSKHFIMNAKRELVLYGGNLSWVDDYKDCITQKMATSANFKVKVFYDKSAAASEQTQARISTLKNIGCTIYQLKEDFNMRCTISDPEDIADGYKVLMIRKSKEDYNPDKNRYAITYADHNQNRELGILIKRIYKMTVLNADIHSGEVQNETE